jgi:ribosomal protein S18 acetylase RimI-like enzyme
MTSFGIEKLILRPIVESDALNIQNFFYEGTGRGLDASNLVMRTTKYPSLIIFQNDVLVGFIVSQQFAPDILELYNIYIERSLRSSGLGSYCVKEFEKSAINAGFKGMIVVNSQMYENPNDEKRPATNFYTNNGYGLIAQTSTTNVFYKSLEI